jgi:hypothetical protein
LKFQKSSQTHNTIPDAKLQNSLLLQIFFLQLREQKQKKKEISSSTPEQIENDDDDGAEEEDEEENKIKLNRKEDVYDEDNKFLLAKYKNRIVWNSLRQ